MNDRVIHRQEKLFHLLSDRHSPRERCRLHRHRKLFAPAFFNGFSVAGCFRSKSASPLIYRNRQVKIPAVNSSELAGLSMEEIDDNLTVEASITRFLPPAFSLKYGLEALKEALECLKLDPPCASSGLIRFEVSLPSSIKAFDLFCLAASSGVFPQFYVLKEMNATAQDPHYLTENCGMFGIGAAVDSWHNSSSYSEQQKWLQRYLLVDSPNVTAYCFYGFKDNIGLSSMEPENVPIYSVVPQIELDEFEGFSLLAGTMVWSNDTLCSFAKALHIYDTSINQALHLFSSPAVISKNNFMKYSLQKSKKTDDETIQVLWYLNAQSLNRSRSLSVYGPEEMKVATSSHYFSIRLSAATALTANMAEYSGEISFIPEACANINALWASLIVEECFRLGLTYFCIAPGSRSSPLAVAAAAHPHTTCIACFDERSLAFHAVGYARGSGVPAVVITTSGTAVSNLLPAVVEASQDFVPLLLLTADRPPELHDTGANQAINQVNHFGSYVKFFFNLPTPSDHVTARMVLTTIDTAVFHATAVPFGPVHLNCGFREPLDGSPGNWIPSCLDKLTYWISSSKPFTKYIQMQPSYHNDGTGGFVAEVLQLIKSANHGILIIGALNSEDDVWATLMLARHISWPVVADILSGLRLRKLMASYPELEEKVIFVDHFDHILLSDVVQKWVVADVILQVGSRITSKRISEMIERCFPCFYVMVDKHPYRHDPSHIVTHRVQCSISQLVDCIIGTSLPRTKSTWSRFLESLEAMVSWEIFFQIYARNSLTEPYIVLAVSDVMSSDTALFVGNSMPIRDADMFCHGLIKCNSETSGLMLPYQYIKVAGNRGASGIDGLLSTASGFAAGCKKRVLCVIGDVSFLHDTNGLSFLSVRTKRKPMTVLVINNHGGAIFSFLPIVKHTEPRILHELFFQTHAISIGNLCAAHGVKHVLVKTKKELHEAVYESQQADSDYVIEAESSIDGNAEIHSNLKEYARQAADQAFSILSRSEAGTLCTIDQISYSLFRIQLNSPPTSVSTDTSPACFHKEGFIVSLSLNDGSIGYGEVAPFQIGEEKLPLIEEQLRYILHVLRGAVIDDHLPLLRGLFSRWIWIHLGIMADTIFPSLRCGLEMAILNALAARHHSSLLSILWPQACGAKNQSESPSGIQICALIDHQGTPEEVAFVACKLVEEGFCALKLKVARRADPRDDALAVQEVRKKVGAHVTIRVDANRHWTYDQALKFASSIKDCNVQYIEEPVKDEDDILRFCDKTGVPVALDETIDSIRGNILDALSGFSHPGIVALVIKPSFVGGFENAALLARWAHLNGKMAVVSAAFESSLSLYCYAQFARYLELENDEICRVTWKKMAPSVAHGLGTYKWLKEDLTLDSFSVRQNPGNATLEASIDDADDVLHDIQINNGVISRNFIDEAILTYPLKLECEGIVYRTEVQEIGKASDANVLLFLHGYLGTGSDWIPIMKALSKYSKCISVDLPGHGRSKVQCSPPDAAQECRLSVEVVSALISKLIEKIAPGEVTLIGYSMGARIALHTALRMSARINGAVIISGSPGLQDQTARKVRAARDDARASSLISFGLRSFVENWYTGELWQSLRQHPNFKLLVKRRLHHDDVHGLGKVLSDLSVGRQMPLWGDLKWCKQPLLLIVGEKDKKFKKVNQDIFHELSLDGDISLHEMVEVADSGHAVHLENPLALIRLVRQFLTKIGK